MQIDEVHRLVLLGVNKTQLGYLSHEELDDFFNRAQRAEFAHLLFDEPTPSGRVRKINRDLEPFKVPTTATSNANGFVDTPDNLEYLIAAITSSSDPIWIKTESQLGSNLSSSLTAPSTDYPMAEESDDGFTIYPNQVWTNVKYWYLETPTDVQYVYSLAGRVVTYNDSSSVHPQWKGAALERVINRAIELGAEYLQSQHVDQKMQIKNQRGS